MQTNISAYAAPPGFNEALQTPFKGAYYLWESGGIWNVRGTNTVPDPAPNTDPESPVGFVENNGGMRESGEARRITEAIFVPDLPISGIATNDDNDEGGIIFIDTPEFTMLPLRVYAGLERPYHVTGVYVNVTDPDVRQLNTIILAINV